MKRFRVQSGLTLVEMLVVVAIVAVLASMAIGIAVRVENQGKERLTRATISILNAALEQFADYKYRYPNLAYEIFDFPVDCNEFWDPAQTSPAILLPTIVQAMSEPQLSMPRVASATIAPGLNNPEYSGCEAMWFFLSQVPDCRKTLDKIDKSLLTNEDTGKQQLVMRLEVAGGTPREYPLLRVVDPWGTTLHYDYYDEIYLVNSGDFPGIDRTKKTFPVITSAGPDGGFGTADDIRLEKKR